MAANGQVLQIIGQIVRPHAHFLQFAGSLQMRRLPHVFALLSAQSCALVDLSVAGLAECGHHMVISLDAAPLPVAPVGMSRLSLAFPPTMLAR